MHKKKQFTINNKSLVLPELLLDKSNECEMYDFYAITFNTLNNVFSYK